MSIWIALTITGNALIGVYIRKIGKEDEVANTIFESAVLTTHLLKIVFLMLAIILLAIGIFKMKSVLGNRMGNVTNTKMYIVTLVSFIAQILALFV